MNRKTIIKLYKDYRVPNHIACHMKKVAAVAVFIGHKINHKNGFRLVKINTVKHAALLHDILKVSEFNNSDPIFSDIKYNNRTKQIWQRMIAGYGHLGHIRAAASVLSALKEPVLAETVQKHEHSCLISPNPGNRPLTWEEKILYYADKRVLHDKIVSMEHRFKEGRQRYMGNKKATGSETEIIKKARQLEKEICKAAGIRPSDII